MAAQRVTGPKRRLQINRGTHREITERRQRESLSRDIRGEGVAEQLGYRQAHALHADAVADPNAGGIEAIECNDDARIAAAFAALLHSADVLDDSGEQDQPSLLDCAAIAAGTGRTRKRTSSPSRCTSTRVKLRASCNFGSSGSSTSGRPCG